MDDSVGTHTARETTDHLQNVVVERLERLPEDQPSGTLADIASLMFFTCQRDQCNHIGCLLLPVVNHLSLLDNIKPLSKDQLV